jgi:hypothetical protein
MEISKLRNLPAELRRQLNPICIGPRRDASLAVRAMTRASWCPNMHAPSGSCSRSTALAGTSATLEWKFLSDAMLALPTARPGSERISHTRKDGDVRVATQVPGWQRAAAQPAGLLSHERAPEWSPRHTSPSPTATRPIGTTTEPIDTLVPSLTAPLRARRLSEPTVCIPPARSASGASAGGGYADDSDDASDAGGTKMRPSFGSATARAAHHRRTAYGGAWYLPKAQWAPRAQLAEESGGAITALVEDPTPRVERLLFCQPQHRGSRSTRDSPQTMQRCTAETLRDYLAANSPGTRAPRARGATARAKSVRSARRPSFICGVSCVKRDTFETASELATWLR